MTVNSYTTKTTTIIIFMMEHKKTILNEWIKEIKQLENMRKCYECEKTKLLD